jgi:hypothetical protein
MSDVKATKPSNYIVRTNEAVRNFTDKADKGIVNAQSFSLFGLRVPKGPFSNKEAVKSLETAQQRARQLQEMIAELFQSAFAPTVQK